MSQFFSRLIYNIYDNLGLVESEKPGNKSPPSLPERSELVKGKSSLTSSVAPHINAAFHSQSNVAKQQKTVLSSRASVPIEFVREAEINENEELVDEEPQHVIETEIESDDPYIGIKQYQDESEIDEMDDQFEATENWNSQVV